MSDTSPKDGDPSERATQVFVDHRELLFSIVYNMLGTVADTEDVLQETWLAWAPRNQAPDAEQIEHPRAYLVRIAVNKALARQAAIRRRRETYVGPWLPEPLVSSAADPLAPPDPHAPDDTVEHAESVSMALLVVLETLTPLERAVFVLHEVFGYAHTETADILGRFRPVNGDLAALLLGGAAPFAVPLLDLTPDGRQVSGIYFVTNRSSTPCRTGLRLGARVPNGVGLAGCPRSLPGWLRSSCGRSGPGWAGFLTHEVAGRGLGAPMPRTIALVAWGRWRPSPGPVALCAPSDHDSGRVVSGGLRVPGSQRLLPVLAAPAGGIGRIHRDHGDALFAAITTSRERSRAVGKREMSCRKRFLRPCFSRVLESVKSRSSTAIACTPSPLVQCSSRVRAWRICASRCAALPDRS